MHDPSASHRAAVAGAAALIVFAFCGCSSTSTGDDDGDGPDYGGDPPGDPPDDPPDDPQPVADFEITLVPDGASGMQRVNFAIPFAAGVLADTSKLRVLAGTAELPAARRGLASHADGSLRSVQIQVDVDVDAHDTLTVEVGEPGDSSLELAAVETTLAGSGNNVHPRVWAVLPAEVIATSQLVGPIVPRAEIEGTALDAWSSLCDYDQWDTDTFLAGAGDRGAWLFDRVTAMYRGYGITGELSPLRSAYREASIYRAGMTIANGVTSGIPVPGASGDLKYHYSQGVALHYLLTGDDRFREAAEAVSARVATLWNPSYDGTDRFWTERHAGFALLAHEWAARVTDDKAADIGARAETAVDAFLDMQMAPRFGQTDQNARCFAHTAAAHAEGWNSNGCSPWMSAILADGLEAHAARVGGARAEDVRTSLARLGRIIARDGRDSTGRPLYWMGVGPSSDEVDYYDEHWGESAYIVALAWHVSGRTEQPLRDAADELIAGLATNGVAGQVRSFNWQCRSAVMAPAFLH